MTQLLQARQTGLLFFYSRTNFHFDTSFRSVINPSCNKEQYIQPGKYGLPTSGAAIEKTQKSSIKWLHHHRSY